MVMLNLSYPKVRIVISIVVSFFSVYAFFTGFFLTRKTLSNKSTYNNSKGQDVFNSTGTQYGGGATATTDACTFHAAAGCSSNNNEDDEEEEKEDGNKDMEDRADDEETRTEIGNERKQEPAHSQHHNTNIHHRHRHRRVFMFIIDALRLDFLTQQQQKNHQQQKQDEHDAADSGHTCISTNTSTTNAASSNSSGSNTTSSSSSHFDNAKCSTKTGIASSSSSAVGNGITNFPFIHQILQQNASQCRLFGFQADPPTVTSQRLQGITSGSLPTFIDIGSNLHGGDAINEDNIIDQMLAAGRRLVFTGDDTWSALFPKKFHVEFPFDSFNTKDLDTVDDGIESHLFVELDKKKTNKRRSSYRYSYSRRKKKKKKNKKSNSIGATQSEFEDPADCSDQDSVEKAEEEEEEEEKEEEEEEHLEHAEPAWDLFIAHFLGVDHIGHTYSAHHPLMTTRLQRYDTLVRRIIEHHLPDDAIFLLFGDHGMTDEGNHGGATVDEVNSGLFVYSKYPLFPIKTTSITTTQQQPQSQQKSAATRGSSRRSSSNGDDGGASCTTEEQEGSSSSSSSVFCNSNISSSSVFWNSSIGQFQWISTSTLSASPRIISQVDLVPTLSMLLGLPIPYSNLGAIIPELFLLPPYYDGDQCNSHSHNMGAISGTHHHSHGGCNDNGTNYTTATCVSIKEGENTTSCDSCRIRSCRSSAIMMTDHRLLLQVLRVNALQVMTYLRTYFAIEDNNSSSTAPSTSTSSSSSLSAELHHLTDMLTSALASDNHYNHYHHLDNKEEEEHRRGGGGGGGGRRREVKGAGNTIDSDEIGGDIDSDNDNDSRDAVVVVALYMRFLEEALSLCRRQWTQFNVPLMVAGCLGIALALSTLLFIPPLWSGNILVIDQTRIPGEVGFTAAAKRVLTWIMNSLKNINLTDYSVFMVFAALLHGISTFSNSFIQEEHWVHLYFTQVGSLLLLYHITRTTTRGTSNVPEEDDDKEGESDPSIPDPDIINTTDTDPSIPDPDISISDPDNGISPTHHTPPPPPPPPPLATTMFLLNSNRPSAQKAVVLALLAIRIAWELRISAGSSSSSSSTSSVSRPELMSVINDSGSSTNTSISGAGSLISRLWLVELPALLLHTLLTVGMMLKMVRKMFKMDDYLHPSRPPQAEKYLDTTTSKSEAEIHLQRRNCGKRAVALDSVSVVLLLLSRISMGIYWSFGDDNELSSSLLPTYITDEFSSSILKKNEWLPPIHLMLPRIVLCLSFAGIMGTVIVPLLFASSVLTTTTTPTIRESSPKHQEQSNNYGRANNDLSHQSLLLLHLYGHISTVAMLSLGSAACPIFTLTCVHVVCTFIGVRTAIITTVSNSNARHRENSPHCYTANSSDSGINEDSSIHDESGDCCRTLYGHTHSTHQPTTIKKQDKQQQQQQQQQHRGGGGGVADNRYLAIGWVIHSAIAARLLFFMTGHKYDFGALQLSAGFIGADKFHYYYAGAMLAMNTFGSDVAVLLLVLALSPYLLTARRDITDTESDTDTEDIHSMHIVGTVDTPTTPAQTSAVTVTDTRSSSDTVLAREKGHLSHPSLLPVSYPPHPLQQATKEAHEHQTPPPPPATTHSTRSIRRVPIVEILTVWLAYRLIVVMCACMCALIHRRHLMVWAIFAPKVIFEMSFWCAVGGAISIPLLLLSIT